MFPFLEQCTISQADSFIGNVAPSSSIAPKATVGAASTSMQASAPTPACSDVRDSSKMNQRLKEMFRERISSFREAVYLLTGYKVRTIGIYHHLLLVRHTETCKHYLGIQIDLHAAESGSGGYPRLKLRSMYAEDPDDFLLFQVSGSRGKFLYV